MEYEVFVMDLLMLLKAFHSTIFQDKNWIELPLALHTVLDCPIPFSAG